MSNIGLDMGTSYIISCTAGKGDKLKFKIFRDAFYAIKPSSTRVRQTILRALTKVPHFIDEDSGEIVIIGEDAIYRAIEHNTSARRPMRLGVVSPKEKDALRVLKAILTALLGEAKENGIKVCYSIPAEPINEDAENFSVIYHEDAINKHLRELGYDPFSVNEAEAIGYGELLDHDLTGICLSFGAGMRNIAILSLGENVRSFSLLRSGDYIDRMVSVATDQPDSVVQVEKEASEYDISQEPTSKLEVALQAYYKRLIKNTVEVLAHELQNNSAVPKFKNPVPIVLAGGTSLMDGFATVFEEMARQLLPVEVGDIICPKDRLYSVAKGCYFAANI